jgi:hypothetical protein
MADAAANALLATLASEVRSAGLRHSNNRQLAGMSSWLINHVGSQPLHVCMAGLFARLRPLDLFEKLAFGLRQAL